MDQAALKRRNAGRSINFSAILTLALAVVLGLAGLAWYLIVVIVLAVLLVIVWALRRREIGRWSYRANRWSLDRDGRRIELIFDERLVLLNRLRLLVDGEEVDRKTIWYGFETLSGAGVTVRVGSGWTGECVGVELRTTDGASVALTERGPL